MSLVLNTTQRDAIEKLLEAIIDGNDDESRFGDMTDNACSHAFSVYEPQTNYINIVGDLTVALLLVLDDSPIANECELARRGLKLLVRDWSKETLDSLIDFEVAQLECVEAA